MPLEIRELHVKAVLRPDSTTNGRGRRGPAVDDEEREQLVADVVEQVLDVLARKEER